MQNIIIEIYIRNQVILTVVTSLYTNIPHDEGVEATTQHYTEWAHTLPKPTPKAAVIKIVLHFILKHSTFLVFKINITNKTPAHPWEADTPHRTRTFLWEE